MKSSALILAILTIFSAVAQAELPAAQMVQEEDLCGKALLGNLRGRENPSGDSTRILNRIVGKVDLDFWKSGRVDARYSSEVDLVTRKKAGDGQALIDTLGNHINLSSPTAVRVEEKGVVTEASFRDFLKVTQSQDFAIAYNQGQEIKWAMRDTPPEGKKFLTITEYGKHLVYRLEKGEANIVVKSRYRKYYSTGEVQSDDINDYQPVMGDLTAFELKITTATGKGTSEFLSTPDTVFKPRIFLNDSLTDRLKAINGSDSALNEKLSALEKEAAELKAADGHLVNEPDLVHSMFKAVRMILEKDEAFLQPTFAVKYERSSFAGQVDGAQYQFTADRNVTIYSPINGLNTVNMRNYVLQKPLFKSGNNEIFIELKSPLAHKLAERPAYTAMRQTMDRERVENYKQGSGKYAIARFVDQELLDEHIDRTIFVKGTQYWLIKGTSNLDSLPKKADVLIKGEVEVAYPFTTETGQIFRIFFKYKPTKRSDSRIAVLEKVKIFDQYGFEVKVKPGFDELIPKTYDRADDEILSLNVAGNIIPFKLRLTASETSEYKAFFTNFFAYQKDIRGRPRSLETLDKISGPADLRKVSAQLRAANLVQFLIDRSKRMVVGAILPIVAIGAYNHITNSNVQTHTKLSNVVLQADAPDQTMVVRGLRSDNLGEIPLAAQSDANGRFYFKVPKDLESQLANKKSIILHDSTGAKLNFAVKDGPNGGKLLALIEGQGEIK